MLRQSLDTALAVVLLALLLPVAAACALRRPGVRWITAYGRFGMPLRYPVLRIFRRPGPGRLLNYSLVLLLVVAGRIAIAGPRLAWRGRARPSYANFGARPGLISPYTLQRHSNIAHDSADSSDARFIRGLSVGSHLGVIGRFLLVRLLGRRTRRAPDQVALLDVRIANHTMASALGEILRLARADRCSQVAFVNAQCFNLSARNPRYRAVLQSAPLVLADGIGLRQALKWFCATGLRDNVNGTDLFPRLCRLCEDEGLRPYLLGARPGVADAVVANLRKRFPRLEIAGARDGYFAESDNEAVVEEINASNADLLLVALGVPMQELWIAQHAARLRVGVAIGVGGLFDFYSGRIPRAPLWVRELGIEWVYRLIQEPGRMWRRYVVGNPLFLWRAWRWSLAERDRLAARNGQRSSTMAPDRTSQ